MANTNTDHMTCVAQNLRGLTHFRSNADDIDALADDRDSLRMALEAMMGVFDTPVSRRKINSECAQEARKMGRAALSPKEDDQ